MTLANTYGTPSTRIFMKVNGVLETIENVAVWTTHTTSHGHSIDTRDYERNFLMKIHESDFNTGSVYHIGGSNENTVQYTFKNSRGVRYKATRQAKTFMTVMARLCLSK